MLVCGVALLLGAVVVGRDGRGWNSSRGDWNIPTRVRSRRTRADDGTLQVIEEEPPEEETGSTLDSELGSPLTINGGIVEGAEREKQFDGKVLAARGVFIFSGLCVIVSSIVFYTKGATAFQKSMNGVQRGLEVSASLARKAFSPVRWGGVLTISSPIFSHFPPQLVQQVSYEAMNMTDNAINKEGIQYWKEK